MKTRHMFERMSQRGINGEMVEFARQFGVIERDKTVLDRRELDQLLAALRRAERVALKLIDKGGIVIVEEGDAQITTYNRDSFRRRGSSAARKARRPQAYR